MNDLEKMLNMAVSLNKSISELLKISSYQEYDDLSGLNIDYEDSQQLFLREELRYILDKLEKVKMKIDYLQKPIIDIGYLEKNERDRYELKGSEFTCGSTIEVLYEEDEETPRWYKSMVEHDGEDYYINGLKGEPMEGMLARIRV